MNYISETKTGCLLKIYAQPGGRKSEILGLHDGQLKIRINAPPVDGKANDEILAFLATLLKIPRRNIELISGAQSRKKTIAVSGITSASAAETFAALLHSL